MGDVAKPSLNRQDTLTIIKNALTLNLISLEDLKSIQEECLRKQAKASKKKIRKKKKKVNANIPQQTQTDRFMRPENPNHAQFPLYDQQDEQEMLSLWGPNHGDRYQTQRMESSNVCDSAGHQGSHAGHSVSTRQQRIPRN